jgi:beta-lactamase regulating signal transducer with metallopeptidase domain
VVVPRWLLARDAREQRAVVAHEREHVASRDHLLLAFASAALALAPWNPLLWYAAARLRLAIELDCDARVVAAGADRRSYATLLIDVAQLARPFRLNALAIAGRSPSHLRRRIVALAAGERRHPRLRAAAATAVTAMALGAASYAPVPAVSRTREAARGSGAGFPGVVIDGEMASAAQLAALDRTRIASVEVVKGPAAVTAYGDAGANGVIVIRTTGAAR